LGRDGSIPLLAVLDLAHAFGDELGGDGRLSDLAGEAVRESQVRLFFFLKFGVPRFALAPQRFLPLRELLALGFPRRTLAVPQLAPLSALLFPELLEIGEMTLDLVRLLERAGALLLDADALVAFEQELGQRLLESVFRLGEAAFKRADRMIGLSGLLLAADAWMSFRSTRFCVSRRL
jgi:hypothetical protein